MSEFDENPSSVARKGTFQKGKSGNPNGRPKGSKNKTTLVKQAIEAEAEGIILENLPKVLKAVIEKAVGGDMQAAKLILDRGIPAKKAIEYGTKDGKALEIKVVVQNLKGPEEMGLLEEKVIVGEYEEVIEDADG